MSARKFNELYFGKVSAEADVSQNAERFLSTYLDEWDVWRRFKRRDYFLVIGPKGVGKTAISKYIELTLKKEKGAAHVFASSLNLDEAARGIGALVTRKLVTDSSAASTDAAWRLFLSLRFFELLLKDQSCSLAREPRVQDLARQLGSQGILGSDFPTVLKRVRENSFSVSLSWPFSTSFTSNSHPSEDVPVARLGESIFNLVLSAESDNDFLLSIDGLDKIIGDNDAYWLMLKSLIGVGMEMHHGLAVARSSVRLVVMCRSDVLRKVSMAEIDKVVDSALFVDWGAQETKARDSLLWDYLAKKAGIDVEELLGFFPREMRFGAAGRMPMADYLLGMTRATPREMTGLMQSIQRRVPNGGAITIERVRGGADDFATRGLLATLQGESVGVLSEKIGTGLEEVLGYFPCVRGLTPSDLESALKEAGFEIEIQGRLAEFLFMAGILGNYDPTSGYVQFYHRRDTAKFRRRGPWILHQGLGYAFNIPQSRS